MTVVETKDMCLLIDDGRQHRKLLQNFGVRQSISTVLIAFKPYLFVSMPEGESGWGGKTGQRMNLIMLGIIIAILNPDFQQFT